MRTQEKTVIVISITSALILLYMIKPAEANAFCHYWGEDIYDKYAVLEDDFYMNAELAAEKWMTIQRESISYEIVCSDITMFF